MSSSGKTRPSLASLCAHALIQCVVKCLAVDCKVGDNCAQSFHLGSYIVGYTVGNLVSRRRENGTKRIDL